MSHRPIALLLALAGCSRPPHPTVEARGAAVSVQDTVAEGTVRVVGPAESAEAILHGATASVGLTGPLVGELRRLSGATLRVIGTPRNNSAPLPPRAVLVDDYEVLEVDGQRPLVGTVLSRDGHVWLAGRDTVELVAATPDLAARSGAKVFVLGEREGDRLRVKSYGVIRDPR
jgi:hypothetical protein